MHLDRLSRLTTKTSMTRVNSEDPIARRGNSHIYVKGMLVVSLRFSHCGYGSNILTTKVSLKAREETYVLSKNQTQPYCVEVWSSCMGLKEHLYFHSHYLTSIHVSIKWKSPTPGAVAWVEVRSVYKLIAYNHFDCPSRLTNVTDGCRTTVWTKIWKQSLRRSRRIDII